MVTYNVSVWFGYSLQSFHLVERELESADIPFASIERETYAEILVCPADYDYASRIVAGLKADGYLAKIASFE
jgi:hypothetical protein